jgi:hypothetical protein
MSLVEIKHQLHVTVLEAFHGLAAIVDVLQQELDFFANSEAAYVEGVSSSPSGSGYDSCNLVWRE